MFHFQEKAVNPTLPGLFPDVDWLIGNHSDELTPWIPVMAARWVYLVMIRKDLMFSTFHFWGFDK